LRHIYLLGILVCVFFLGKRSVERYLQPKEKLKEGQALAATRLFICKITAARALQGAATRAVFIETA